MVFAQSREHACDGTYAEATGAMALIDGGAAVVGMVLPARRELMDLLRDILGGVGGPQPGEEELRLGVALCGVRSVSHTISSVAHEEERPHEVATQR